MPLTIRARLFYAIENNLDGQIIKLKIFDNLSARNLWIDDKPDFREPIRRKSPIVKKAYREYYIENLLEITEF